MTFIGNSQRRSQPQHVADRKTEHALRRLRHTFSDCEPRSIENHSALADEHAPSDANDKLAPVILKQHISARWHARKLGLQMRKDCLLTVSNHFHCPSSMLIVPSPTTAINHSTSWIVKRNVMGDCPLMADSQFVSFVVRNAEKKEYDHE